MDDLKPRSIKVGDERWARWQAAAKAQRVSLTALIIERMETPVEGDAPVELRESLTFALATRDAEIAELKRRLSGEQADNKELRDTIHQLHDRVVVPLPGCADIAVLP